MFNKLKQRVELLEDGETKDLEIIKGMSDRLLTLEKRTNLLEKCDNFNTMYQEQADKRIAELEENLRLVYEYLGVHKEVLNETVLVDDECKCDECYLDEVEEEFWEDVKPKKAKKK